VTKAQHLFHIVLIILIFFEKIGAGRLAGLDSTRIFPLALAHPFAWIYSDSLCAKLPGKLGFIVQIFPSQVLYIM